MSKIAAGALLLTSSILVFAQSTAAPGEAVYSKHCASCHDSGGLRIPPRSTLQQRTSASILKTLNSGVMQQQAAALSFAERLAVAQWLGRKTAAAVAPSRLTNSCKDTAMREPSGPQPSWTSWGGSLANLRFQTADAAGLTSTDVPHLKLKWVFGVPDVTYVRSQPAVYQGRLLFGGGETLYSIDASSGCTYWATETPAAVRSGISIASPDGKPLAFFGDQAGNVHAVDVATGSPVWQIHADTHPAAIVTGTPVY
ncbi:MAG: PQQ-binding-like beta-propeller repeat protein, partial [Acidobacteriaceae bacterium]|nr:PQQ-binding-like beta-propeller repeat protein [Acidobacteriaceae bacterium]